MYLLDLFKEYGDKQEILSKLREDSSLRKYNSSELHIIAAIGDLAEPNVTSLAQYMGMTRGGISKNVKKLMDAGLILSYQKDGNTKNIYYRLTDAGKAVYEKHAEAHKEWIARDRKFMKNFSDEQIQQVTDFMVQYIEHIDEKIRESENNGKAKQ
ncbi:MAG: MarR family transcriptional regulator [Lachnospiraceae bacterium]|nr:MarR family transcriptional regulator [Lachnospiraceae bacterium]